MVTAHNFCPSLRQQQKNIPQHIIFTCNLTQRDILRSKNANQWSQHIIFAEQTDSNSKKCRSMVTAHNFSPSFRQNQLSTAHNFAANPVVNLWLESSEIGQNNGRKSLHVCQKPFMMCSVLHFVQDDFWRNHSQTFGLLKWWGGKRLNWSEWLNNIWKEWVKRQIGS